MEAVLSTLLSILLSFTLVSCGTVPNEQVTPDSTTVEITEQEQEQEEKEEAKEYKMLTNTLYKLTQDKQLTTAYIGGSITYGQGASTTQNNWVELTNKWFSDNFEGVKVNGINAGISNTGSNYAIFRFEQDVLSFGTPDIVFLEFTSNDWGRFGKENISRQTESLIRLIYKANPKADIVFVYTGRTPSSSSKDASKELAAHYQLAQVDVGVPTQEKINNEYGGDYKPLTGDNLHPNDAGYAFYSELISAELKRLLIDEAPDTVDYTDIALPETLNKTGVFENPKMINPWSTPYSSDWKRVQRTVRMGRSPVTYEGYLETTTLGAEHEFKFSGTGFGVLVYKSPDVSNFEYSIDGAEFKEYIVGEMHYYDHGQMYICEYNLPDGEHTVKIRNIASPANNREKEGSTLRIIKYCVNESVEK